MKRTTKRFSGIFLIGILLILCMFLVACGKETKTPTDTGTLTFQVAWAEKNQTSAAVMKAPLDCTTTGVATVEAAVYDQNNNLLANGGPWSCDAHQGEITDVPAGVNRTIIIVAKDGSGIIVYQGEKTGISVVGGQTISAGEIVASSFRPAVANCKAGDGQITVNWEPVDMATSYNLYWSLTTGVTKTTYGGVISHITATTYVHAGLANGTSYYYVLTAVNAYGESGASIEVNATPDAAPSVPGNVSTQTGNQQVTINWSPVEGADSYKLYWATATGVSKTTYSSMISDITATAYTHTGLSSGTTYYYVVTAVNAYGESNESPEVNVKAGSPPLAPANVKATSGTNQITITWNAAEGAESYSLHWSTASASGVISNISTLYYSHTSLASLTIYFYVVTAVNAYGESEESLTVSALSMF